MATVYNGMTSIRDDRYSYFSEASATAADAIQVFMIPSPCTVIVAQAYNPAGTFYLEGTASSQANVLAANAVWFDLMGAEQAGNVQYKVVAGLTAIRVRRTAGTIGVCVTARE